MYWQCLQPTMTTCDDNEKAIRAAQRAQQLLQVEKEFEAGRFGELVGELENVGFSVPSDAYIEDGYLHACGLRFSVGTSDTFVGEYRSIKKAQRVAAKQVGETRVEWTKTYEGKVQAYVSLTDAVIYQDSYRVINSLADIQLEKRVKYKRV